MAEKSNPGCASTLVTILFIVFIIYKFDSCGGDETKTAPNTPTNKAIQLTHADSIRLEGKINKTIALLDRLNVSPNKARKQFVYFLGEIQNYRATNYECYEAAKVGKDAFDNAYSQVIYIEQPDSLPEDLVFKFNTCTEDAAQYFRYGSKAFQVAMQMFNGNNDLNLIDECNQDLANADVSWKSAEVNIAEVRLSLMPASELKKHKSKPKSNNSSAQSDSSKEH